MGVPAIKRATRPGKQRVEVARRRCLPVRLLDREVETAAPHHGLGLLPACFDLRLGELMSVPVRRGINEHERAITLRGRGDVVSIASVLRTQINRRLFRQPAATEDVVELRAIVRRETNVVMGQFKSAGASDSGKRHG